MIEIKEKDYIKIAGLLEEAVCGKKFFNGSLDYEGEGFFSTLTTTLLIYHESITQTEGVRERITEITPVWWDFATTADNGAEDINDFSFTQLRNTFFENR